MTTTSRRQFLQTLGLVAIAPLVAARALMARPPLTITTTHLATPEMADLLNQPLLSPEANRAYIIHGRTIKVPSNRVRVFTRYSLNSGPDLSDRTDVHYVYRGEWDGTLKDEAGCSNPAWVYHDLLTKANQNNPWGVYLFCLQTLYDFGVWCDELVYPSENVSHRWQDGVTYDCRHLVPRFTVNTMLQTDADIVNLREDLRMRFIAWKAQDERYRTSWPMWPIYDRDGSAIVGYSPTNPCA